MQAYLVGGAVRDALLGRSGGDRDWVVVGATPEQMVAAGYKPVGRDFPVFLHPHNNEEYALARTERKSGRGYHGFQFHADASVTLEQDLARRDFTINAIAQRPDGALVDPFNGCSDIQQRVLRHVTDAFAEDPVRVLRAARFMARFAPLGFRVEQATMDCMRGMVAAGEVDALVPERVWQELRKALGEPQPSAFLQTLRACGALARVLPEVDALYGVPQRLEFHPEGDTGVHLELVLDMCARLRPGDALVAFAALCHDLGKALTPAHVLPAHIGHEHGGTAPTRALCERLRVPTEFRDLAVLACREHLNVHRMGELKPATVHDLITRCDGFRKPGRIDQLAVVCEADKRGRAGRADAPYPQAGWLRAAHAAAAAVQARDVLQPGMVGAAVGEALRRARIDAITATLQGLRPPRDASA